LALRVSEPSESGPDLVAFLFSTTKISSIIETSVNSALATVTPSNVDDENVISPTKLASEIRGFCGAVTGDCG
jgi:hypothetical protein